MVSLLGPALLLAACSGGPQGGRPAPGAPPGAPPAPAASGAARATPPPAATLSPEERRLGEIDLRLAAYDAAQAEGRVQEAEARAADLAQRVEADFVLLAAAARGAHGPEGAYVGTMAMGFARRAEATAVLVEQLAGRDARLVANALLALKLRADPATPLGPLGLHVASRDADVRRYAPLAVARVLEARRRVGMAPDRVAEDELLQRMAATLADQDPLVRLHTARALGEVSDRRAVDLLMRLLEDASERVRLGAAVALGKHGHGPGFVRTVQWLEQAADEDKPLFAAALAAHAGRLQGRPLTPLEERALGVSAPAWARWYAALAARPPGPTGQPTR
ncbi:MAG: HEAT repeat domain-containing protein [Planctomycetia bacterium]